MYVDVFGRVEEKSRMLSINYNFSGTTDTYLHIVMLFYIRGQNPSSSSIASE